MPKRARQHRELHLRQTRHHNAFPVATEPLVSGGWQILRHLDQVVDLGRQADIGPVATSPRHGLEQDNVGGSDIRGRGHLRNASPVATAPSPSLRAARQIRRHRARG